LRVVRESPKFRIARNRITSRKFRFGEQGKKNTRAIPTVIEEESVMNRTKQTALTLALGSAIAASLAAAPISAAENPFVAQSMGKAYMVAEADKAKDGKCGGMKEKEGACGGAKKKDKEGACGGAKKKDKEGKCGAKKSAEDAEANKKMLKEGKCGEGKCGAKNLKEGKCGK
jgi:uncharacterized low-complexity protein